MVKYCALNGLVSSSRASQRLYSVVGIPVYLRFIACQVLWIAKSRSLIVWPPSIGTWSCKVIDSLPRVVSYVRRVNPVCLGIYIKCEYVSYSRTPYLLLDT